MSRVVLRGFFNPLPVAVNSNVYSKPIFCFFSLRYRPIQCPSPTRRLNSTLPVAAIRPGTLQMSEPIPVPSMRAAYAKMRQEVTITEEEQSKNSIVPRSQPINMTSKQQDRHNNHPDISSLSPPSVLFTLGTPPNGGRRRSSNSLSETPPPPNLWQVSPGSKPSILCGSPLRKSSPILLQGTLALLAQQINSPDNNNTRLLSSTQPGMVPFNGGSRLTLPEIAEGGYDLSEQEMSNLFHPPELPEETILDVS